MVHRRLLAEEQYTELVERAADNGVHVTVHPVQDHLVTTHLKSKGDLISLLTLEITTP